jgi:hypothetical protein
MERSRKIAKVFKKVKLREQNSDFAYWQSRPYQERLAAWAEIRREFHGWQDDTEPRLERVPTITKRK